MTPGHQLTLPLALPKPTDDLESTANKLAALADTVKQGNSLALFTGLEMATPHTRDAETIARSQMSAQERQAYDAWKEGRVGVPDFDWEGNVAAVPGGAQSQKKFGQRAVSMDVIWGVGMEDEEKGAEDNQAAGKNENGLAKDKAEADFRGIPDVHNRAPFTATAENASWLTFNMPTMLPLVNGVTRVLNAQKQAQQDPHAGLSDMEAVEAETARKIVATAERNRSRELERIRQLTRSISENAEVLKNRAEYLERQQPSSEWSVRSVSSQTAWQREKKRKQLTDPEG